MKTNKMRHFYIIYSYSKRNGAEKTDFGRCDQENRPLPEDIQKILMDKYPEIESVKIKQIEEFLSKEELDNFIKDRIVKFHHF